MRIGALGCETRNHSHSIVVKTPRAFIHAGFKRVHLSGAMKNATAKKMQPGKAAIRLLWSKAVGASNVPQTTPTLGLQGKPPGGVSERPIFSEPGRSMMAMHCCTTTVRSIIFLRARAPCPPWAPWEDTSRTTSATSKTDSSFQHFAHFEGVCSAGGVGDVDLVGFTGELSE